jgi:hypothetical protein
MLNMNKKITSALLALSALSGVQSRINAMESNDLKNGEIATKQKGSPDGLGHDDGWTLLDGFDGLGHDDGWTSLDGFDGLGHDDGRTSLGKLKYQNPMREYSDDVKYGDILQVNAHDALSKQGHMTWIKEALGCYIPDLTGATDGLAACQFLSPSELATNGVTCLDVRVANTGYYRTFWSGIHSSIASNLNAIDEMANFLKVVNKSPETIYTIKYRGPSEFLDDLSKFVEKNYEIELGKMILSKKEARKEFLNDVTLGDARKNNRNLVIINDKPKENCLSKEWVDLCWDASLSTYGKEQSECNGPDALVDVCMEKIHTLRDKPENENVTVGSTMTPTLSFKGMIKNTCFYVPLNAVKYNSLITTSALEKLENEKTGTLQFFGMNGIKCNDECVEYIKKFNDKRLPKRQFINK